MKHFSLTIMASPERKHYVDWLLTKLPNTPVVWDRGLGIWDTCRQAWELRDKTKPYHLVLQEDTIIPDNFIELVDQQLAKLPDRTAAIFYTGELAIKRIKANHGNSFYSPKIYNEVAICLPSDVIDQMLHFAYKMQVDEDKVISRFCRRYRVKILNVIPSLVEHRADVSLYRQKYNKPEPHTHRHAVWYIEGDKPDWL
jgi:hypothetical protein